MYVLYVSMSHSAIAFVPDHAPDAWLEKYQQKTKCRQKICSHINNLSIARTLRAKVE